MEYETVIVDGCTIITIPTKKENPNKYISKSKQGYRVEITYCNQRYYIGVRKTLKEARELKKETLSHIDDGTFLEWFKQRKKRG